MDNCDWPVLSFRSKSRNEVEYEDGIGIQNESLDFAADIIESDEHWSEDD